MDLFGWVARVNNSRRTPGLGRLCQTDRSINLLWMPAVSLRNQAAVKMLGDEQRALVMVGILRVGLRSG
jgi:hypothetical protein